ncbi:zinc-dependent alcohol dehydrogenase [Streptomyces sp. MAR4 CNX-425]|uniref:zinc-dependent alcohol dehydrogenase n=1 Tax=Streptomyces sp. MAR4 CNX-425 TaxID=3406343 RepID=UPI003B511E4A
MRAFVLHGPGDGAVVDAAPPAAGPGEAVVDVARVGLCGTDVELYSGELQYLRDGRARFPVRPGHEWSGRVAAVGTGADPGWVGRRVTGDTMLGCRGPACRRCRGGRQHLCEDREEVGIRGRPGALAAQLAVPAWSLHALPDPVDDTMGALVEPGGNALRAARAAVAAAGDRVLVAGPGTIGLLTAMFARRAGAEVHVLGRDPASLEFAASLGFDRCWTAKTLPPIRYDAVVDASNAESLPARAVELVEPGGRVVFIGLAGTPSLLDTRALALKDATAVGVLSASPGLAETITAYAEGSVDPRPLVAATVGLEAVAGVLSGTRPQGAGAGPKVHVSPGAPGAPEGRG